MSELGSIPEWRLLGNEPEIAAIRGRAGQCPLPTQSRSFMSDKLNVCFRLNPPYRYRDRASSALMNGDG